jgi:hypothetical protein
VNMYDLLDFIRKNDFTNSQCLTRMAESIVDLHLRSYVTTEATITALKFLAKDVVNQ